jgi:hypothetical protein
MSPEKEDQFIRILTSMSNRELNDFIKSKGKGPKLVPMCVLVRDHSDDEVVDETSNNEQIGYWLDEFDS